MLFITVLAYRKPYKTCKHCFMLLKWKKTVAEEKRAFNSKWEILCKIICQQARSRESL